VPDMALNFFIVFALYCALQCIRESGGQRRWRYLFFVSCGLGFMIKGFAALIVPVVALISYTLLINRADVLKKMNFATGTLVILAIALPWFAYMRWLHGNEYFQYMLQVETYNRMTSSAQQHMLVKLASTFVRNALFYLETLGSYFAPWSGLMLAAVPLAVVAVIKRRDPERSVLFAVNWFFAVFIFFSLIHARINHLILVLSTPFAIIVALFLLGYLDDVGVVKKIAVGFRRGMSCVILIGGLLGLSFVRVFLLGSTKLWLPVFLLIFVGAVYVIFYRRKPLATAILLCVFLLFSYSQAGLLSQARLTSHASLQGLAHTINQHINEDTVIGVGSHDIHEKELQVYFERQVEKAATSDDAETQALLRNLFTRDVAVYCILTEKDYQNLLDGDVRDAVAIVQREQIFRRRVTIDAGFFTALLALDRQAINRYLMETILLIRKEQHA